MKESFNLVKTYQYLLITLFFLMNIIKSDSLLYVNNFMLFIFAINLDKYFEKEYMDQSEEDVFLKV